LTCLFKSRYHSFGANIVLDIELGIQIEKSFVGLVSEDWLKQAAELTLASAGINYPVELGLVIADDNTVHELNRIYRGVDDTTDVIAFTLSEHSGTQTEHFIMPPDDVTHLGEVIISLPQASEQASMQHHPLERELALLVAHGILHLVGYDHERPEDDLKMRAMEAKILQLIGDK
jgi:probable rRNA maturation factor